MNLTSDIYSYRVSFDNKATLYKLFTIKREDKPIARFWKKSKTFESEKKLLEYCLFNGIPNVKENEFIIADKIEYL